MSRPAEALDALSRDARTTFAGLFNGARTPGQFVRHNGRLFVGKAECEWHWPQAWDELRDAGLITYRLEDIPSEHIIGGTYTKVHFGVTERGHDVREDDLARYRESTPPSNEEGGRDD